MPLNTFTAGQFQPNSSSLHVSWQLHNLSTDCAKIAIQTLERPSKSSSLQWKNFFGFGFIMEFLCVT